MTKRTVKIGTHMFRKGRAKYTHKWKARRDAERIRAMENRRVRVVKDDRDGSRWRLLISIGHRKNKAREGLRGYVGV